MIINHYLADKNAPEILDISGSYKFTSWIKNIDESITHSSGVETSIYIDYPEGLSNKYYQITYTVVATSNSGVYVTLGNSKGIVRTTSGTYTETLLLTGAKRVIFTAYGDIILSNLIVKEYIVIADPLDLQDTDAFINHSWTLSYSLINNAWVSFHSYIPNYYITTTNNLFSYLNDEVSVEYTLRDEYNNYITDSKGSILTYK
jgi:hypothetical protein